MIKRFEISILVALSLFISGCITQNVRGNTVTNVLSPPDVLVMDIAVEPPPSLESYLLMSWTEKEEVLVKLYRTQTLNLESANLNFKLIREWKIQQLKLYSKEEE